MREISRLFASGRMDECLEAIEASANRLRGKAAADMALIKARILSRRQDMAGAVAVLETAILSAPRHVGVHRWLGKLQYEQGDVLEAFRHYKFALRASDQSIDIAGSLLTILIERHRYAAAGRLGRAIDASDGLSPSVIRDLVEIALLRFDADAALRLIERARG